MKTTTRRPLPAVNPHTRNLLDTAADNGTFKTFGKAVEQAGLSETLNGPGPFTIFAPTDAAFEKLPADQLETMFKPENKQELASLVNYHALSGHKLAADIGKWDSARTLHGQSVPIVVLGKQVSIDGAIVCAADIGSSNGVMHGIDKVNMPAPTKQ